MGNDELKKFSRRYFLDSHSSFLRALATELTSTLSILLIKRLRLGNGQPTYRHGTGTSRIASERYEDTFASITPCEQLKFNKAQLAKMETFRRCKQACVDALMMMPDHHPDEPFYVRALTELQDIEETMALAKTARKVILENTDNEDINLSQNKFELPQGTHFNNLENSGPVANENPNGSNNSASQNVQQNQLPPPIMLFVEKNYKAQMAAITKEFPKIRSRLTVNFKTVY
ncbi:hypothetical protein TNCV_1397651 [Trichonephila clavipes]|nr:hypothetical protein TNCV_1397651 [Trichonephila clavipes]